MFKNLLIDWVTELNEKIATAGDSGYLTISLSAFNPTLYAYGVDANLPQRLKPFHLISG